MIGVDYLESPGNPGETDVYLLTLKSFSTWCNRAPEPGVKNASIDFTVTKSLEHVMAMAAHRTSLPENPTFAVASSLDHEMSTSDADDDGEVERHPHPTINKEEGTRAIELMDPRAREELFGMILDEKRQAVALIGVSVEKKRQGMAIRERESAQRMEIADRLAREESEAKAAESAQVRELTERRAREESEAKAAESAQARELAERMTVVRVAQITAEIDLTRVAIDRARLDLDTERAVRDAPVVVPIVPAVIVANPPPQAVTPQPPPMQHPIGPDVVSDPAAVVWGPQPTEEIRRRALRRRWMSKRTHGTITLPEWLEITGKPPMNRRDMGTLSKRVSAIYVRMHPGTRPSKIGRWNAFAFADAEAIDAGYQDMTSMPAKI